MSVLQNIRFLTAFNRFMKELGKDDTPMKYLGSIFSILTAAAAIFQPDIQNFMSHHVAIMSTLGAVIALVNHALPSPIADKADKP